MDTISITASRKEIPFLIQGYDPFPIYQESQPKYIRTAPIPENVSGKELLRNDHERTILFGINANGHYEPNILDKFKDCVRMIGGLGDHCEWVLKGIQALPDEDMLELLTIVRKQENKGK